MGMLALAIALSIGGGQATDLSGSLVFLIGNPFGKVVLVAMIVGLSAYSLWGLVRAIFDPLHRGRDTSGVSPGIELADRSARCGSVRRTLLSSRPAGVASRIVATRQAAANRHVLAASDLAEDAT